MTRQRFPRSTVLAFKRAGWRWSLRVTGYPERFFLTRWGCRRFAARLGRDAMFMR